MLHHALFNNRKGDRVKNAFQEIERAIVKVYQDDFWQTNFTLLLKLCLCPVQWFRDFVLENGKEWEKGAGKPHFVARSLVGRPEFAAESFVFLP